MNILELSLKLAVLILTGFAAVKLKVVDGHFRSALSKLIMNILLPCLIIDALYVDYSASELLNCGIILLVSCATLMILFLIGHVCFLITGKTELGRVLRYGVMFPNYTFIGLPVADALFGAQGVFYFTIFSVPVRIFYYSLPRFLLTTSDGEKGFAKTLKNIFSPPLVAVFIALVIYIAQIKLPIFIDSAISSLSSATSTFGMLLCGMILAEADVKKMFKNPKIFLLTFIRNFAAPVICLLAFVFLPIDKLIIKVAIMYASLPAATLLSTFVLRYTGSEESAANASANTFLSTALSIVTIPVWAHIMEIIIG